MFLPTEITILGVGNLLLSDEGVGIHIVNHLLQEYHIPKEVQVIDGGTAGMELLNCIANVNHLILLDAVMTGSAPGTVIRLENEEIPALWRNKLSPHQVGLSDVLAAAYLIDQQPKHVVLFGVVPKNLALGMELSSVVQSQLIYLVEQVVAELKTVGISLQKKREFTRCATFRE